MSRFFGGSLILFTLIGSLISCQKGTSRNVGRTQNDDVPQKTYRFDSSQGCYTEGIVNGVTAKSDNPLNNHLVMIMTRFHKEFDTNSEVLATLCTGTLIGPNTVLTAAHCFPRNSIDSQIVASMNLFCSSGFNRQLIYSVVQTNIHPMYKFKDAPSPASPDYDIAVVKFEGILPSHYVPLEVTKPNILAEREKPFSQLVMAGYGRTRTNDEAPPELRFVTKPWTQLVLQKNSFSLIDQMNLIGISQTDSRGGCSGDSGGPLLVADGQAYRIMGVASYIESVSDTRLCEQGQIYYSYLSSYWDWLTRYLP